MTSVNTAASVVTAVGVVILLVLGILWQLDSDTRPDGTPGVAYAGTTVNCKSGKSFKITTGNASGSCTIKEKDGTVVSGFCTDGINEISASCEKNDGQGACGNSQGSGNCENGK